VKNNLPDNQSNFLLYTGNDGNINIEVFLKDETVWLTQKAMGDLFGVNIPAISKHLKNIFDSGELNEGSVISILETTATDYKKYKTKFYNLDAIISVGYRVNSYQATQFRIWATRTLKEFIIKGFVLDDERLKQGNQVFQLSKNHTLFLYNSSPNPFSNIREGEMWCSPCLRTRRASALS